MAKPIIGLSTEYEKKRRKVTIDKRYLQAVEKAGGSPLLLPVLREVYLVRDGLRRIDGLILIGADDYSPKLYGGKNHPKIDLTSPERERFDLELARQALRLRIPILGICGGLQLVNIVRGGSLAPHVSGHSHGARHYVEVKPGSRLFSILKQRKVKVYSSHHQVVDRPGRGLKPVAFSPEGYIEALEDQNHPFLVLVQWHPERMPTLSAHRLFTALVKEARCRR